MFFFPLRFLQYVCLTSGIRVLIGINNFFSQLQMDISLRKSTISNILFSFGYAFFSAPRTLIDFTFKFDQHDSQQDAMFDELKRCIRHNLLAYFTKLHERQTFFRLGFSLVDHFSSSALFQISFFLCISLTSICVVCLKREAELFSSHIINI